MAAALASLPLLRWASRLAGGSAVLEGRLVAPLDLDLDGELVALGAGPARVAVSFLGGPEPRLTEVHVQGVRRRAGAGAVDALRGLLDHVHDARVDARAWSDVDLVVKLGHGLEARLPAGELVTLRAVTLGPPDDPRLVEVLDANIGGAGVRFSLERARWLTSLARVNIHRASLHPSGQVDLEGRGLGLLRTASHHVSDLIRRSPRFARVRALLDPG